MIIIDDETASANILAELLDYTQLGFNISGIFEDVPSALDFIALNDVSLVVSDIRMPETDGLDLLKIINENYPNIKVVLISAYRDFEYAKKAISYNAFEYITKPIDFDEYVRVIERVKNVIKNENAVFINDENTLLLIEEIFCDFLNDVTNESSFTATLHSNHITQNILNSKCNLLELSFDNIDFVLQNKWSYGRDKLFTSLNQIISIQMYDCYVFTIAQKDNGITLLIVDAGSNDLSKSTDEIIAYIKFELNSLFYLDVNVKEIVSNETIFSIKSKQKPAVEYLIKTTMSCLINNDFDEIIRLRNLFFQTATLQEIQEFLIKFSQTLKSTDINNEKVVFLDNIAIKSITNIPTLKGYFDNLINKYSNSDTTEKKQLEKTIILEAIQYMNTHYGCDITLSGVAKHVMLNSSYFSNYFKKQTGECFSDYLLKIRMERAMELIRENPKMKIHAVCEAVGYRSQPYFYKAFRSYCGCSPSDYRK